MTNFKSIVAVLLLFLMFSFIDNDKAPRVGVMPGDKAPAFQIENSQTGVFDLKKEKEQYVLLNFWATYDAPSRITNVRMRDAVEKLKNQNIRFISVSYDPNQGVYEETVKLDRLNESTQFYDKEGAASSIYKSFRLQKGFGNYLLDKNGVILAKNLSPEKLAKWVSQ